MARTLDEVMSALPAARRRRVDARAAELIAEEMTLRELRRAVGKTQAQLARKLGKTQTAISRIEAQSDMLMSTLGDVVAGLGGRVSVLAELPGRASVRVATLGDLGAPAAKARRPVAKAARQKRSGA